MTDIKREQKRGQAGGKVKNPNKGFGSNNHLAQIVAKKGGMISRRGVAYKTHITSLTELLDKMEVRDWADIIWEYEPQVEYAYDDLGHLELVITSFSQDLLNASSAILEEYIEDYEAKYVTVSDKMYNRLQSFVDDYVEKKSDDIYSTMIEDQEDYIECMDERRAEYRSAVGA